ncbi:MAG: hypothetical protein H2057_05550 [Alphaproteobacteria bacterium]|nr:hypothetical protein [Alphaproteobacteria bacterium]
MTKLSFILAIMLCSPLYASSGDGFDDFKFNEQRTQHTTNSDDLSDLEFDAQGTDPGPKRATWYGSSDEEGNPFSDDEDLASQEGGLNDIFAHWPQHPSLLPYDGIYVEDKGLEDTIPTYSMVGTPQQQTELIKVGFGVSTQTGREQHVVIKKPDHQKASLTFTWEPQRENTWAFSIACQDAQQILREDQSSYEKDNALMVHYDPDLLRFVFDGEEKLPRIHLLWAADDEVTFVRQEILFEIFPLPFTQQ